jgi:cysteine desulfurase/selenocysteine lyase
MSFDAKRVREDFPIFREPTRGRPLVYLDSAATTQKPRQVIDALVDYYTRRNSNVGRGVYALSIVANQVYESARETVSKFIGAQGPWQIVFTRGTTESVNLVAHGYAEQVLSEGDEILVSGMEHHGNLCPWQIACQKKGAKLRIIPLDDRGDLDLGAFRSLLGDKTKLVAVSHVSNVLGTVNPVREIIRAAHERGVPVLVDGAQAVAHRPVDVSDLDCDFYCFSGHKMYGPMGIGVLYAKEEFLEKMPPYQTGGGILFATTYEKIQLLQAPPQKFEAGTPNVEGAVGLAVAAQYLMGLGLEEVHAHETDLLRYATEKMNAIEGLTIYGKAKDKAGLISFLVGDIHPYDVGVHLDEFGVAVRTGVHCTMPLIDSLRLPVGTVRASFGVYSTRADIDTMCTALGSVKKGYWSLEKPGQRV